MKKSLLFVGIDLSLGGTEQAFLSAVRSLDSEQYDITLLLARRSGSLLSQLPSCIQVRDMGAWGEWFTLSAANARHVIPHCLLHRNPLYAAELVPYLFAMAFGRRRREAFHRMWLHFMQKMPPLSGHYDAVLSFWGDRTMFYAAHKIDAAHHVTWMHFDYTAVAREDRLYEACFSRCDRIAAVSRTGRDDLRRRFPALADRFVYIPNRIDAERIRTLAKADCGLPRTGKAVRLLTVARLSPLKGIDLAIGAMAELCRRGVDAVWYFVGGGDPAYRRRLTAQAEALGCAGRIVFMGERENPYPLMADCDIYVQPSRSEAMPLTVEEAMILCRPTVITRYPAAREQTDDGRYGVLCSADSRSIADAVASLIASEERRSMLTRRLEKRHAAPVAGSLPDLLFDILGTAKDEKMPAKM